MVSLETVGFTDGVHLFSSDEDAERWMLQEICKHGGNESHLTIDEFQQRLKPHEDFYLMELHDRRLSALLQECQAKRARDIESIRSRLRHAFDSYDRVATVADRTDEAVLIGMRAMLDAFEAELILCEFR